MPPKTSLEYVQCEPRPNPGDETGLQSQTPFHLLPDLLLILGSPFPPHLRCLNVRRTLVIWLRKHAHNRYKNLLHTLNR